jgi:Terpene cyclase DEP1
MTRTRQLLCIFYGLIALTALIMTWSQNLLYFQGEHPAGFGQYLLDLKVNGAARSFTVDIGLFLLAATGLMVVEARKLGMRFVWAYVILGFAIAISVTFPLFLIAREIRLTRAGGTGVGVDLTLTDILGLVLTTVVVLAMCGFILT